MIDFRSIKEKIQDSDRIIITAHTSPDGDALGSSLGLYGLLKKIKDEIYVVFKEYPQKELSFLPWFNNVLVDDCFELRENDTLFVLDCGNTERINFNVDVKQFKNNIINIDHHKSNEEYGSVNWIDTNRAAVGEMIYNLASELEIEVDAEISECLYTSILTDTGAFKYSNTSKETHRIAGELIQKGIDFTDIHEKVYERKSFKQIKLYAKAIESMELYFNDKLCVMEITQEDIDYLQANNEDLGDLINLGMKIESVEVAMMIKDKGNIKKGSLRSKKYIDVCEAAGIFFGGGHVRAAGFSTEFTSSEVKEKLIKYLEGKI